MSEFDVVKKTRFPNTFETIKKDLINIGIQSGDTVLVHSSMSKIGWVCGDEQTIVEALLDVVGEDGTIVMPAYTAGNSNPDEWSHPPVPESWREEIRRTMPCFDVKNTPTRGMGRIAECFRNYTGTVRSNHPQLSFCANGKYKNEIVQNHELSYGLGMNSPLGKLYELNSKVLLLGVGYSNCTCMHLSETLLSKPNIVQKGASINMDGKKEWVWFDDIDYNSDCFDEIGSLYEKKNRDIVYGKIGDANSRVLNLKSIVNYTKDFLEKNNNFNIVYTNCGKNDKYTDVLCNGKNIGYFSIMSENDKYEISDLCVLDEYKNRGFGRKILKHCIDLAKINKATCIYTYVFTENTEHVELFTKCGFIVRELIGDTRCVMSRKIDND